MSEWIVIASMGVVTFFTRAAGVGLAGLVPRTPFWQRFMQHVPATLLVAIVAPLFTSGDLALTVAAAVTLVAAAAGAPLVIGMAAGVGAVALMRLAVP